MEKHLTIVQSNFQEKVHRFFSKVNFEKGLKENFIDNPLETVRQHLDLDALKRVEGNKVSESNKLLFNLLANKEFTDWLKEYQRNVTEEIKEGNVTDTIALKQKVYEDVARAIIWFGDIKELENIMKIGNPFDASLAPVEVSVEVYVVAVAVILVVVAVIDITPFAPQDPISTARLSISVKDLKVLSEALINKAKTIRANG